MHAISIGGSLASDLQGREITGTVHSVFRRAVNLHDKTGDLMSILGAELGNASRGVLVDLSEEEDFRSMRVAPGASFHASSERIALGALRVTLRRARVWDPDPQLPLPIESAHRKRPFGVLEAVIRETGSRDGLWGVYFPVGSKDVGLADPCRQSLSTPWSVVAAPRIARLVNAWRRRDLGQASWAASELVGLGPGLTPSGDDFLGGCLALLTLGASTPEEQDRVAQLGDAVLAVARTRTNVISYTMLRDSARGRPAERVRELIGAILTSAPARTREAATRLLRCGESSGTDSALGVFTGFRMLLPAA